MNKFINLILVPAITFYLLKWDKQDISKNTLLGIVIKYNVIISLNFLVGKIIAFILKAFLHVDFSTSSERYLIVAILAAVVSAILSRVCISVDVRKKGLDEKDN